MFMLSARFSLPQLTVVGFLTWIGFGVSVWVFFFYLGDFNLGFFLGFFFPVPRNHLSVITETK